ncbi:MAG TPA: hypothetical protein VFT99_15025, partial [Roseiflexaceae bacterium]|nr:hypothetical protein [Roseiflexaceae bacterium]
AAAATALAAQRALGDAKQAAVQATRPLDRARSHAAIAQAAAEQGQLAVAQSLLAEALREVAWLGRSEALACLGWAGETLALLGGADLLLNVASTLDELDSWWSN